MRLQKQTLRPLFFLFLLMCLLSGLVGVVYTPVKAASSSIVITQVYGGGGNAGAPYTNDYVELFNLGSTSVSLTGWSIQYATTSGATWTAVNLNGSISAGQYYLIQLGSNGANGSPLPTPDITAPIVAPATTPLAINSTDGKIALVNQTVTLSGACPTGANIIDFVGYGTANCSETASAPAPSNTTADIRSPNQCIDSDNNSSDFIAGTPNPRNTLSFIIACLRVTSVTSPVANATYIQGNVIPIQVTFSNNVNVTGSPTLLLETGATDEKATYVSGSGTSILTFNYTVLAGDVSGHLDYVASNSLALNGGTITGAVGNADLTLPSPGTAGSLGANKNIVIDNGAPPSIASIKRQAPLASSTNADTLVFRVTFSKPVTSVDAADFVIHTNSTPPTTTTTVTGVSPNPTSLSSVYDVTISGGDLAGFNGDAGLDLSATPSITDAVLNPIPPGNPSIVEVYVLDNIAPTVTIDQALGQADPTGGTPINFTVTFSEAINVSSFTTSDITAAVTGITWKINQTADPKIFTLSAVAITAPGLTTIQPSILPNQVTDIAGNGNIASTSTDNSVTFNNAIPPSVTVNQAVGQADPTATFPVNFTVVFSKAIIASIFTPSDITQNGTATGVTWNIVDSGDHATFILSATTATGAGSLIPSIAANRVTDLLGNNNTPSTSTDNVITFVIPTNTPPPIRTPTPGLCGIGATPTSIIINEIAWAGTGASTSDQWIEFYNPTTNLINLNGWILRAVDGTPNIPLASVTLASGQYYLLERTADTTVSDVPANQIFTGAIGTVNEVLQLYNSSGICVDTANSNSGAWPAGSATTRGTMERRGIVPDSDTAWITNVNPASWTKHDSRGISSTTYLIQGTPGYANWAFSVTATPSPIPSNTSAPTKFKTSTPAPTALPPPPPLIAISEFVPRPAHDWNQDGVIDVGDEYIEIINHGVIDVNLSGYSLDDEVNIGSVPYRLPAITLKPGERRVFYGKETGLLLSDGGDGVRLLKPNGQLGDAYNYTVVRYPDQAYCRLPDDGGLDPWSQNCFPTPGLKNSLSGSFVKPPTAVDDEQPLCPISDILPIDFAWAECPSFGNMWSRFYWDAKGWFGEKSIPDLNSKWDVYVD